MLRDAEEFKDKAYAADWEQWWGYDQDLVTERLNYLQKYNKMIIIDRGRIQIAGANLAVGRVDRYNWKETQNQPNLIDMHCENNNVLHPDKLEPFLELYNKYI